jgi:peptide/nickel transport system permease protein
MIGYIIRRFLFALLVVWAISCISFFIIQLPKGDYIDFYIIELETNGGPIGQEAAETLRMQYGLEQPIPVQYIRWIGQVVAGNGGYAFEYRKPAFDVIGDRIWLTLALTATAVIFTWLLAVPIGIYSAMRQYSIGDYLASTLGFMGLAVPPFLLALVMMYYFKAVWALPVPIGGLFAAEFADTGWTQAKILNTLAHMWVPALIVAIAGTAQLIRVLRANLLDEIRKPYVVTARAKGMSEWGMIMKYPVRVAMNPLVSTIGYLLPTLVSGSIIVEVVMNLPTMGPLLLKALLAQDMFLAGTIVMLIGIMTVVGTFASDLLLAWIDPRIRVEQT